MPQKTHSQSLQTRISPFTLSDAWVLAAIRPTHKNGMRLNLKQIIAAADWLNHAILTFTELRDGLEKLQRHQVISLRNDRIYLNKRAQAIFERVDKSRGGLFTRIGKCLEQLNMPQDAHKPKRQGLTRITRAAYNAALTAYHKESEKYFS